MSRRYCSESFSMEDALVELMRSRYWKYNPFLLLSGIKRKGLVIGYEYQSYDRKLTIAVTMGGEVKEVVRKHCNN
jgi:hypothetical protein